MGLESDIHRRARTNWTNWLFVPAYLIVAFVKMWSISDLEIVARNRPLDELWYIRSADNVYWFSESYDHLSFCRQPGYPLWIALVGVTGLPLRVAMEMLVIGASCALSLALIAAGIPLFAGFLIYLLMAFHPYTFQLNCIALQDMFYGPLLWLGLAAVVHAYARRSARKIVLWAGIAGLLLAVLWNTRPETQLIVGLLVVACLLFGAAHAKAAGSLRGGVLPVLKTTVIIAVGILAVTTAICTANYLRFGLFVPYDLAAPGYKNAMAALLSIETKEPIRHVSVSREAMERAAAVSPSFQAIKPGIDEWAKKWYSRYTPPAPGEIVAGQFYWAFRRAVGKLGYHDSALAADGFYQRIADEINAACAVGMIPCRKALLPIISSDVWALRAHIPPSFLRIIRTFVFKGRKLPYAKDNLESTPRHVRRLFDKVAHRRTHLTAYPEIRLEGELLRSHRHVSVIAIRNQQGAVLASTRPFHDSIARHVQDSATAVSGAPEEIPFHVAFTPSFPLSSEELVFRTSDGNEYSVPLVSIRKKRAGVLRGGAPGDSVRYEITQYENLEPSSPERSRMRDLIYAVYKTAVSVLSITGLAGLLACIVLSKKMRKAGVLPALLVLLFMVVARVGLFTILDATSWVADRIRYIYPVVPLYVAVMVSFTALGVEATIDVLRRLQER